MRPSLSRRASVLPAVFALSLLIAGLLVVSSDRVMAVKRLQDLGMAKQQATYAAEAIAALKEVQMVNLAAANDLDGLDSAPTPNSGTEFFGNCLVRWRIEPVQVDDATGTNFTVNPVADANELPPPGNYVQNYEFYVYRIATEAHYLADAGNGDVRPFELALDEAADGRTYDATTRVAAMQATRVIQLKLNSLFKYAIFYAAEGTTGDLEFWVGTGINVRGAVHSNGSIYIGGQGNQYLGGNYYDSCSYGGSVNLGGSGSDRISICGVDGIFRMRKGCNVLASRNPGHPLYDPSLLAGDIPDPRLVPLSGAGGMVGSNNLNGDTVVSDRHKLNGINFTSANDSRSPTWIAASPFAPYVRDNQVGGTVVKTLSNIPQLSGRPFEHQRFASDRAELFWRSDTDRTFTIVPNVGVSLPLYYTDFAAGVYTPTEVALAPDGSARRRIYARNMLLYDPAATGADVWPDLTAPPAVPDGSLHEGFAASEVRGYYLGVALDGDDSGATSGLVFRERPAQKAAYYAGAKPLRAGFAAGAAGQAAFGAAYRDYLKSQYMALFKGFDVTDEFFAQIATAATEVDFIASEDDVVNMREATAMQVFYGVDRAVGMNGRPYSVNIFTLNLRAVQDWLRNTAWSDLLPGGPGNLAAQFNGLIYAHRTRRSETYHPLLRPLALLDPYNRPSGYTLPVAANWPHGVREGSGPIESFHCAVRVRNGANINWAHASGVNPLGTSGLTLITPNMCYVQGDYNTTRYPDASGTLQSPPCAIFADGLTALSNSWSDAAHTGIVTAASAAIATSYVLSYVINNVPTDDITAIDEGSGAVANVVRFLENWGGREYSFRGSLVVMNRMRYGYTTLGASPGWLNLNTSFYSPPRRNITFNTDLLSRAGQPPFTPYGVNVIRTVSTVVDATE